MFNERKICPVCGSENVGLYNSRKTTYRCYRCDSYWRDRTCIVIENNYLKYLNQRQRNNNQQYHNNYRSIDTWNGYTDPDDFPTDGLGDNGY